MKSFLSIKRIGLLIIACFCFYFRAAPDLTKAQLNKMLDALLYEVNTAKGTPALFFQTLAQQGKDDFVGDPDLLINMVHPATASAYKYFQRESRGSGKFALVSADSKIEELIEVLFISEIVALISYMSDMYGSTGDDFTNELNKAFYSLFIVCDINIKKKNEDMAWVKKSTGWFASDESVDVCDNFVKQVQDKCQLLLKSATIRFAKDIKTAKSKWVKEIESMPRENRWAYEKQIMALEESYSGALALQSFDLWMCKLYEYIKSNPFKPAKKSETHEYATVKEAEKECETDYRLRDVRCLLKLLCLFRLTTQYCALKQCNDTLQKYLELSDNKSKKETVPPTQRPSVSPTPPPQLDIMTQMQKMFTKFDERLTQLGDKVDTALKAANNKTKEAEQLSTKLQSTLSSMNGYPNQEAPSKEEGELQVDG